MYDARFCDMVVRNGQGILGRPWGPHGRPLDYVNGG